MKRKMVASPTKTDRVSFRCPYDIEPGKLLAVTVFRVCSLGIWISAIAYATYQVYQAADLIPWQSDPILNPGPLTHFFDRGRDNTDLEWNMFLGLLVPKLMIWLMGYIIVRIVAEIYHFDQQMLIWISPIMSGIFLYDLLGWKATVFLFSQPVMFYMLMQRFRSKLLIWGVLLVLLVLLNQPWLRSLPVESERAEYFFTIIAAWNYARCISFCFDMWERKETSHEDAVFIAISYCFYFPLLVSGPLVLCSQFEKDMLNAPQRKPPTLEQGKFLLKDLARMAVWIFVAETVLHCIYFGPLALTPSVLRTTNLWVLCGVIYWLGQFFMLKYVVMYGIGTAFAKFDGLEMPPLPKCIAYLHRYSVLWKDFDRGLYNFLKRYTYLPILQEIKIMDSGNRMSSDIPKLIASLATFTYVYIWHSVSYDIFIWTTFNFIGITIEKVGSNIKTRLEAYYDKYRHPLFWDFVVEPVATIPLAAMSILNSSVFCGSLPAAIVFTWRMWTDLSHNYTFCFLYFFTHVAVGIRTWEHWWPLFVNQVENRLKKN